MKLNRLRRAHLLLETQNLNLEMRRRLATGGAGDQAVQSGDQDGNQGEQDGNQGDEELGEHAVPSEVIKEVMPGGMLLDDEEQVTGRDSIDISITIDLNNSLNPDVEDVKSQSIAKEITSAEENLDQAVEVANEDAGADAGVASESGDSEISFTLSPGPPEPSQKQFEPDGQMVDLLYGGGAPNTETQIKSNRKFEPDGEMVDLLYGGDNDTTDGNIPPKQFEPDSEVAGLIYGAGAERDNSRENKSVKIVAQAEGKMAKLLQGDGGDCNQPNSVGITDQPESEVANLLYGNSNSERYTIRKSVKIVTQAEGQMAELLQGNGRVYNQPKSVSITDQPDSEVANLLYGNSGNPTEKGLPGSEKSDPRTPEEGPNSDHGAYEPEGQMKGLLYGDGKSTAPKVTHENVTHENVTHENVPTVGTKIRGDAGGRMKSLLYGSKEESDSKIVEDTDKQIIPATFSDVSSDSGKLSQFKPRHLEYCVGFVEFQLKS